MSMAGLTSVLAVTYFEYDHFTYEVVNNAVNIVGYDNYNADLEIPDYILGNPVTEIKNNVFDRNKVINSVSFPDTLTTIGNFAFRETNLSDVTIPASCESIGTAAFQGCNLLKTVNVFSKPEIINSQTFYKCSALTEFVVPDSVKTIGNLAFASCDSLSKIVVPEGVNEISDTAFKNSNNVTLYVKADSYALNYAIKNSIPYVIEENLLIGDANLDGKLNVNDATLMQKALTDLVELSEEQKSVVDVNGDGSFNILDVTSLQYKLAFEE